MLKKEKQVLFPGFIQALTVIAKEITDEKKDKIVKNISLTISLLILIVLISPFLIKYI